MSGKARRTTQRSPASSRLVHPLLLAVVPAVAAIAVAIITISWPSNAIKPSVTTATQSEAGISFRVDLDVPSFYDDGYGIAFEGPLPSTSQLPDRKDYASIHQWAASRGGVPVGTSHLRLYLQNDGSNRVTLRDIRAKVVERETPVIATFLGAPSAGENNLADLRFDLDKGDVAVATTPAKVGSTDYTVLEPFFSSRNISLDPGESTDIMVTATTKTCLCRYKLIVEIIKVDSTVTLEIGDRANRPFVVTGSSKSYTANYVVGGLACSRKEGIFAISAAGDVDCSHPV